jgi:hypothetical protein
LVKLNELDVEYFEELRKSKMEVKRTENGTFVIFHISEEELIDFITIIGELESNNQKSKKLRLNMCNTEVTIETYQEPSKVKQTFYFIIDMGTYIGAGFGVYFLFKTILITFLN